MTSVIWQTSCHYYSLCELSKPLYYTKELKQGSQTLSTRNHEQNIFVMVDIAFFDSAILMTRYNERSVNIQEQLNFLNNACNRNLNIYQDRKHKICSVIFHFRKLKSLETSWKVDE